MMTRPKQEKRTAFTLIEMMVVVTIIGIMIAAVFKLMGMVGENRKEAQTIARLQRVQNALSGYYAEFGTYPPVAAYGSPDPFGSNREDDFADPLAWDDTDPEKQARSACWAAKCQPVAFEFPNGQVLDAYVNVEFADIEVIAINQVLGDTSFSTTEEDWKKIKMFKFGLLSYLLPRVTSIGFIDDTKTDWDDTPASPMPKFNFYRSRQWRRQNPVPNGQDINDTKTVINVLRSQKQKEDSTCARWMPNFENTIHSGNAFFGIETRVSGEEHNQNYLFRLSNKENDHCTVSGRPYYSTENGSKSVLRYMTVRDGWGAEIYYHSAPPYQSYRLWSAGRDRKTFPPWILLQSLTPARRKIVSEWMADDLVRFDK